MKKNLIFWCFLGIFTIKSIIALLFVHGPIILPDEGCYIETAKQLAYSGHLINCGETLGTGKMSIPILVSFFNSIPYYFLDPLAAFKALLILNSLLVSSLIYPVSKIIKTISRNKSKAIIAVATLILFIPTIFAYEKTVMSETLFIVINIWLLHFYLKYKTKKNPKDLVIAGIAAIASALTRPYGFISLISLALAELSSCRKQNKTIATIILILIIALSIIIIPSGVYKSIQIKALSLLDFKNLIFAFQSIVNQVNSLSFSTLFLPLIAFLATLKNKKETASGTTPIKKFMFIFILLNLLISAQHIYGYYLSQGSPLSFIFRYINVSTIFLIILFFGEILKKKDVEKDKSMKYIVIGLIVIGISFFAKNRLNNPQLVHEYSHLLSLNNYFPILFITTGAILFMLQINKKTKIAITIMALFFALNSYASIKQINSLSKDTYINNTILQALINNNNNILYLTNIDDGYLASTYWGLLTLSENKTYTGFYDNEIIKNNPQAIYPSLDNRNDIVDITQYDYAVSEIKLPLTKILQFGSEILYKTNNE